MNKSPSKQSSDPDIRISPATSTVASGVMEEAPISKTMHYKTITKPLLERKRRARMNSYLDELKDIMTECLQAEGENVSKLEKADILELTVRHLQKLSQAQRLVLTRSPMEDIARFRHGYSSCAQEAAQFLVSVPGIDIRLGQRLVSHLMGQPQQPSLQSFVQQRMLSNLLNSGLPTTPSAPGEPCTPLYPRYPFPPPPPCPSSTSPPPPSDHAKTVPVKPAPIRISGNTAPPPSEPVWKPYSK